MTTLIRSISEYRVVVPGPAVSFRSARASAYKRKVRRLAKQVFPKPLLGPRVEVLLDYFHTIGRRIDIDNVAKCILDGLSRVAYVDDRQVRIQSATEHHLQFALRIHDAPVDLIKPLSMYDEYVFVRVRQGEAR